jgi:hypothetical protein
LDEDARQAKGKRRGGKSKRKSGPADRTEEETPERGSPLTRHRGVCFQSFSRAFAVLLFTPGLTLLNDASLWCEEPSEPDSMVLARFELVHAFLEIIGSDFFAWEPLDRPTFVFSLPEFDCLRFLKSVCQVSNRYLQSIANNSENLALRDLLKNCFAFCTFLFVFPEVRRAFSDLPAELLLKAVSISPESSSLLNAGSAIATESVSFLFMAVFSNPQFVSLIGTEGYSNSIMAHLLHLAQLTFEKSNYGYLHSLLLSIVVAFASDSTISEKLGEPFTGQFGTKYAFPGGSHADLLVAVLMNICPESLSPSFVAIFWMIAPWVTEFSMQTSTAILGVLEQCAEGEKRLLPLLLESLVWLIHRKSASFRVALAYKTPFFKRLEVDDPISVPALATIRDYLAAAARAIRGTRKPRLSNEELGELLGHLPFEADPVPKLRKRQPPAFGGELEKTWGEWQDLLFVRASHDDIQTMRVLKQSSPVVWA